MTNWVDATESGEYVVVDYVVPDYVSITFIIIDGSGTAWSNASDASTVWTNQ